MALDGLTALANTGSGTDVLAGRSIGGKFVGAVMMTDSAGAEITTANPVPQQLTKLLFTASAGNSTTAQLAAAATFTGAWEDIFNQPAIQVLALSDQAMTYEVQQAIDAAGTQIVSTTTFTRSSGQQICENVQLNGNYVRVRATNNGASTTTTLVVNTAFGILNPLPQGLTNRGNLRIAAVETEAAALSSYNVAGVIAINTVLLTLDCSQYRSVSIQCVSMGTTGVVTPEWSNDGTNWQGATFLTQAGVSATTFNAAGLWVVPVMARYLRLRLSTATTAGTTTLSVHQFNDRSQMWLATQPISGTVTATVGTSITGGTISPLTVAGVSVEASSAKTASGNSAAAITNASGNGAVFLINVSAVSGTTPTMTVKLQVQDTVSASWADIPGAVTASLTAAGLVMLTVCPGITEAANSKVSFPLPRTYRLAWTIGGTTPSFTFSVSAQYIV